MHTLLTDRYIHTYTCMKREKRSYLFSLNNETHCGVREGNIDQTGLFAKKNCPLSRSHDTASWHAALFVPFPILRDYSSRKYAGIFA